VPGLPLKTPHLALTVYLYVSCDSYNKQLSFPDTAVTNGLYRGSTLCSLWGTDWNFV